MLNQLSKLLNPGVLVRYETVSQMLCEKCKKKPATIFFTEVKNNKKQQHCFCARCAKRHSDYIEQPSFSYSLQDLIGHFLDLVAAKGKNEEKQLKCNQCGLNYNEFRRHGRFGCANCYREFAQLLGNLFQHIHNADQHCGRSPSGYKHQQMLERLLKKLQKEVDAERYEEAAKIRDRIKMLEGLP